MDELPEPYGYKAKVRSVYDADTIRVDIDLGCNVWINNEPIRLYGIDAWELRGDERDKGIAARDFVRSILPVGQAIRMRTFKDKKEKYGRWLGVIWFEKEGQWVNLNLQLVSEGHAVVNFYE